MNDLLALCLNGYKTDTQQRNNVVAGEYQINATLQVTGTIKVGVDYDTAPTVSLPIKEILALFIARAGITRESSMAILREVAGEAIRETGKASGELAAQIQAVNDTLEMVQREVIDRLPRQNRKGPVSIKGIEVKELEPAQV